ncbi:EF hand [Monaibacterium marinum]|uniref:EF hand n=1 Tax=Pontivivens marinum TaxID=1690039 RepID=A0A2C9CLZ4_9RHOB|nr:EF-hand domain-containing protein [Monaibacterium marinum]SOH92324.1 EF hand [Monaibacterium marinum]
MTPTFKKTIGATVLLALLAGTTAVSAQDRGRGFDFSAVDTNGDGEITAPELDAHRAAQFARIDTDGNGSVDASELQAAGEAREQARRDNRAAEMLERADANDDGVLSQEELQSPRRGGDMFERLDADGNGSISAEELEEAGDHRRGGDRKDHERGHRHNSDD